MIKDHSNTLVVFMPIGRQIGTHWFFIFCK